MTVHLTKRYLHLNVPSYYLKMYSLVAESDLLNISFRHSISFFDRASQGSLVSFSLLRLLHCLLSKSSSVSVSAYAQIRAMAAAKGLKLQTLFSQYKNPICQVWCFW